MIAIRTQSQIQAKAEINAAMHLRQAMDAHRQNKFAEAERAYRAVLAADPIVSKRCIF